MHPIVAISILCNTKSSVDLCALHSKRRYLSTGECLEDKREDYQNCSVLYCISQLYTMILCVLDNVLLTLQMASVDCQVQFL